MGRVKISRGKQQVLLKYLPGKTFDFGSFAMIARVKNIRGIPLNELSPRVLINKIAEDAKAWKSDFRPVLRDEVLDDPSNFVLLDPRGVQAEIFPKVFWCNRGCSRVYDCRDSENMRVYHFRNTEKLPSHCPVCKSELAQFPFVLIHACGALLEWLPPQCPHCHTNRDIALYKRGSERISNFRWRCLRCQWTASPFAGTCPRCFWPDAGARNMGITVHRAGKTLYARSAVLLNIPDRQLDAFLNQSYWQVIAAAKYLNFPEVSNRQLRDFKPSVSHQASTQRAGLSGSDLDSLFQKHSSGELTPEQILAELQSLRQQRQQEQQETSPDTILKTIVQRTGVDWPIWEQAGQQMLEMVLPLELGHPVELLHSLPQTAPVVQIAHQMGLSRLTLISDYPIITATYGYTRAEYLPKKSYLNAFPHERDHDGKLPIYVDQIQADALLLSLNPERVYTWLERNGAQPILPNAATRALAIQAYFVELFHDIQLQETLQADRRHARFVFGLLHTLSHLCVRQAALLCGLDRTSLSEYLLPRTLTFAIYCNHRFGATIGALTALFEQSAAEWLKAIDDTRHCVYDPVCRDREGSCHACTHLSETSCRHFNLNLNRAFLFGGHDEYLDTIDVGYFDPSLP